MFTLPGDTFKSTREDMHFHRDMTYTVSKVLQNRLGILIYLTDKYGYDTLMEPYYFEATGKTGKAMFERQKRAKIQFMIDSGSEFLLIKGHYYDWEKNSFYSLGHRTHYTSDAKAIGRIRKYKIEFPKDGGRKEFDDKDAAQYIYSLEEFYKYFDKHLTEDEWEWKFRLPGITSEQQTAIDHMKFVEMNQLPMEHTVKLEQDVLEIEKRTRNWKDKSFDEFEAEMIQMIFDGGTKNYIKHDGVINDIMILYRELPSSHSGTSVSKILTGKSKINNSKVNHLVGKYATLLKQPQMYELASEVESFLFHKRIFMTKEEYCSGTEFRGAFEYIGSKYINDTELNKLIA